MKKKYYVEEEQLDSFFLNPLIWLAMIVLNFLVFIISLIPFFGIVMTLKIWDELLSEESHPRRYNSLRSIYIEKVKREVKVEELKK